MVDDDDDAQSSATSLAYSPDSPSDSFPWQFSPPSDFENPDVDFSCMNTTIKRSSSFRERENPSLEPPSFEPLSWPLGCPSRRAGSADLAIPHERFSSSSKVQDSGWVGLRLDYSQMTALAPSVRVRVRVRVGIRVSARITIVPDDQMIV